jgi:hypothetical protein
MMARDIKEFQCRKRVTNTAALMAKITILSIEIIDRNQLIIGTDGEDPIREAVIEAKK